MGKIIPFPVQEGKTWDGKELTDSFIRKKILAGEAKLLGVFEQDGCPYTCYWLDYDNQTYYIFDLSSWRQ